MLRPAVRVPPATFTAKELSSIMTSKDPTEPEAPEPKVVDSKPLPWADGPMKLITTPEQETGKVNLVFPTTALQLAALG